MPLIRPPRLRTLLLLCNLAVLALPLAGLWAMRLYESALVRQTESELVAQAAVLSGVLREQLRTVPRLEAAAGPAAPTSAALLLARRPGLDLATDPVLPPQPEDQPGSLPEPAAARAGQALTPVLRDVQAITLASLRITDGRGVIVASTGSDLGRSLAAWPEVAQVLAGTGVAAGMHAREAAKAVPGGISRTAGLRVFVAMAVDDGAGHLVGTVLLSRTPNTLGSALWGKRWPLAALAMALLAGGALLAAGLSRLVTRPLGRVVAQARAVADGGRLTALAHPGTREVAALSQALARMAATLEQRADYIGAFAASVSHEFKTPLAAIRAGAELLEDYADTLSPTERIQLSRRITEGAARLDLLVGRLLELARADMMRADPQGRPGVAIGPLLAGIAARFRATGMAIQADGTGMAATSAEAVQAVLTTLVENAASHAPGAAVRLTGCTAEGRVRVTVADDGPGIAPQHRDSAFEPFFTTARDRGGTGLGLPIARALMTGLGGRVTLQSSTTGAAFLVDLPEWRATPPGEPADR